MANPSHLLADLVRLPSVNPMGRAVQSPDLYEHRVSAYLDEFFRALGVPVERQPVAPLRENVVARFDCGRPAPTLLWEAHQDTVPTDGMTIDPFAARVENGRLYGRGACDMKGGMASMLTAFARLVEERPRAANVIMACTVDEEHTFTGVTRLFTGIAPGKFADAAVVGEPTRLNIVHAHKGVVRWRLIVGGRACHSSSPELGVNAIYRMARLLVHVERFAGELRASACDPVLGPPTLSVGRIEGGTSVNTVPDGCQVEIDRRLIPGEDPRAAPLALAAFLRKQPDIDFPFECTDPWTHCPALAPTGSAGLVTRLGAAIDGVVGGHQVHGVPFGTDASTVAEAGIPVVVFGPGDIAQAHTKDEWVELAQLDQAAEILYRVAVGFSD